LIKSIAIPKDRKVRLWIDELPDSMIKSTSVLENAVITNCKQNWNIKKIGIELYLPQRHHSNYGFLGIEILPVNEHDTLFTNVHYVNSNERQFGDTIAYEHKTVYCGIREEYAETIHHKTQEIVKISPALPPGAVNIITGAHCEIGSSKALFRTITEIILSILMLNRVELSDMEIQKIVKDLLAFH
jgi:hypothetical protein